MSHRNHCVQTRCERNKCYDPLLLLGCGLVTLYCCCHKRKNPCLAFFGTDTFTITAVGSVAITGTGTVAIPFVVGPNLAITESSSVINPSTIVDPITSVSIAPYPLLGATGIRITFNLAPYCRNVQYNFNYIGNAVLSLVISEGSATIDPATYTLNWSSMNIPGATTLSVPTVTTGTGTVALNNATYSVTNPANNPNGVVYLDILNSEVISIFDAEGPGTLTLSLSGGQIVVNFQTL